MSDKIHDMRIGGCGDLVSNGYYAVTSAGHIVLIPANQCLKDGFRLATQAEIDGIATSPGRQGGHMVSISSGTYDPNTLAAAFDFTDADVAPSEPDAEPDAA